MVNRSCLTFMVVYVKVKMKLPMEIFLDFKHFEQHCFA